MVLLEMGRSAKGNPAILRFVTRNARICLKPVNLPYLEIAQRLSGLSVEKLRAMAEGLLDITL